MGKLLVLNVVLVLLAVYASALYTYKSADDTQVDEEIDAIAKALNDGNDNGGDDGDDDVDCSDYCDEDCNCDIDECVEVCYTLNGLRSLQTRGSNVVDKKLWGIRLPRIPTPRLPRVRIPRVRVPRFRVPRIRIPPVRRWGVKNRSSDSKTLSYIDNLFPRIHGL